MAPLLLIRSIQAGDSARLAAAFDGFSDRTRHLRFLGPKPRLTAAELRYLTDVVVADEWQGRGVGTQLMRELVARAAASGIPKLTATTLHENAGARALLRRVGFRTASIGGGNVELELELQPPRQAQAA